MVDKSWPKGTIGTMIEKCLNKAVKSPYDVSLQLFVGDRT